MTYIGITTVQGEGIGLKRACTQCGASVEPISYDSRAQDPTYCAHCGHKFNRLPKGMKTKKLVDLLNAYIEPVPADEGE